MILNSYSLADYKAGDFGCAFHYILSILALNQLKDKRRFEGMTDFDWFYLFGHCFQKALELVVKENKEKIESLNAIDILRKLDASFEDFATDTIYFFRANKKKNEYPSFPSYEEFCRHWGGKSRGDYTVPENVECVRAF